MRQNLGDGGINARTNAGALRLQVDEGNGFWAGFGGLSRPLSWFFGRSYCLLCVSGL